MFLIKNNYYRVGNIRFSQNFAYALSRVAQDKYQCKTFLFFNFVASDCVEPSKLV